MRFITAALRDWLLSHGFPVEGVRIIIEFPTEKIARRAEVCAINESTPWAVGSFGRFVGTMNGIGVKLTAREAADTTPPA